MAGLRDLDGRRYDAFTRLGDSEAPPNPTSKVVWRDELAGDLPNPAFTFLLSGPPEAAMAHVGSMTPIGMVQGIQYATARQSADIPELGAKHYHTFGSRFKHNITIGRIWARSANLLGALYRWHIRQLTTDNVQGGSPGARLMYDPAYRQPVEAKAPTVPARDQGRSYQIMSVDSDLLAIPLGLYVLYLTDDGQAIAGEFWERCMVMQLARAIDVNNPLMLENMQLVARRVVPMLFGAPSGGFARQKVIIPDRSEGPDFRPPPRPAMESA